MNKLYLILLFFLSFCNLVNSQVKDSNDIQFNVRMLMFSDAYRNSAWSQTEVNNFISCDRCLKLKELKSNILSERFQFYLILDTLISKDQKSVNDGSNSKAIRMTHFPNHRFIVGFDSKLKKMYRLVGFSRDDIYEFIEDVKRLSVVTGENYKIDNKKEFINNYFIEELDLKKMYRYYLKVQKCESKLSPLRSNWCES